MNSRHAAAAFLLFVGTELSHAQTSPLYMIYSPNVIYPVGTTYVYQNGQVIDSWTHANTYEIPLAVAGGVVRQGALYNQGSGYTLDGTPTGAAYPIVANTYDAASDGNSIYGWDLISATLNRYDLNWNYQESLFSLGPSYAYYFMGITYDPQNNSIWLSPWSTYPTGTGYGPGYLYNLSLTGQLLGQIPLASPTSTGVGLAYDPADNTLWFFNWGANRYEQYSKTGVLLGTMSGITRIYGAEFAAVPEPSVSAFCGGAVLLLIFRGFTRKAAGRAKTPAAD
jgi:hypothetical protein